MANRFQIFIDARDRASATFGAVDARTKRLGASIDKTARALERFGVPRALTEAGSKFAKAVANSHALGRAAADMGKGFGAASKAGKGLAADAGAAGEALTGTAAAGEALGSAAILAGAGIGVAAAGLAAAGVIAAKVSQKWADLGFNIRNTGRVIGVSTRDLQDFRGAGKMFGVDASAMDAGLNGLGRTLNDARWGRNATALAAMNQLGLKLRYAKDGTLDVKQAMLDLSDILARQKSAQSRQLIADTFGVGSALPALLDGSAKLRTEMDRFDRSGAVLSDKQIERATRMKQATTELSQRWSGLAKDVINSPFVMGFGRLSVQGLSASIGFLRGTFRGVAFVASEDVRGVKAAWRGLELFFRPLWDRVVAIFDAAWARIEPFVKRIEAAVKWVKDRIPKPIVREAQRFVAAVKGDPESKVEAPAASSRFTSRPVTRTGMSAKDLDAMVRTVVGEALPGDARGQGDVAHVILNRMAASGKAASDIVHQRGQFEPWMNPARRAYLNSLAVGSKTYQDAKAAVLAAIAQHPYVDPTKGAVNFVSPAGQAAMGRRMPSWARDQDMTLARGGHQFYRGAFPGGASPTVMASGDNDNRGSAPPATRAEIQVSFRNAPPGLVVESSASPDARMDVRVSHAMAG
ncbi:cell wall hydrolase [Phenylobacterium sp.]|uniref:cell wall hydrolase n=1 Tax=Phenylobacterium sp. TaxID=1871053 RepID=UPI0035AE8DEA